MNTRSASSSHWRHGVKLPYVQEEANKRLHDNDDDPVVCIICDDGGEVIFCEGPCHRHFHATRQTGRPSGCQGLGMNSRELKSKNLAVFICTNCNRDKQACFICKEVGSSAHSANKLAEVVCCDVAFCHHFYHPTCVVKMIPSSEDQKKLLLGISNGTEPFNCSRHRCTVCGKEEMEKPGVLVQCRRCPTAWHQGCLKDHGPVRCHSNRYFSYCRRHPFLKGYDTPLDHKKFADP